MKLLHTSDWHLGRALYGRNRYEEFEAFLDWLHETLISQGVDLLLVAGDIFDTTTPSTRAQELYYRFLHRVANSRCRHVVISGGNHDSPSFLNAPKALLRSLNVHVTGSVSGNPEGEVVVLRDLQGNPEAVLCTVPYLRDRDIRSVEAGESMDDKTRKLLEGIEAHYREVCRLGEEIRSNLSSFVPLVATGHLFAAGGRSIEGDGVREIYVGSLARVTLQTFPDTIDYLALGHLHIPQKVGGMEHIRYSGSPLPIGFGEARQEKKVVVVSWSGEHRTVEEVTVPCFQPLERVSGTLEAILGRISALKAKGSRAWLEIEYSGDEVISGLLALLEESIKGSRLEIRRVKIRRVAAQSHERLSEHESLDELNEVEVFQRCLDARQVPAVERPLLLEAYREVVQSLHEEDLFLQ